MDLTLDQIRTHFEASMGLHVQSENISFCMLGLYTIEHVMPRHIMFHFNMFLYWGESENETFIFRSPSPQGSGDTHKNQLWPCSLVVQAPLATAVVMLLNPLCTASAGTSLEDEPVAYA